MRDPFIPVLIVVVVVVLLLVPEANPFYSAPPVEGSAKGVRQSGPSIGGTWTHMGHRFSSLASIDAEVRVLGTQRYYSDREAQVCPIDLAAGWGRMADPEVYNQLKIWQSRRWYYYRWSNHPPIPPREIIRSSANMHLIPASTDVAATLFALRKGQIVRLKGQLVEIRHGNWGWRSSLTRSDSGAKACEVVWVESAEVQ